MEQKLFNPAAAKELRTKTVKKDLERILGQISFQASKGKSTCAISMYFRDSTRNEVTKELTKLGWVIDKKGWVKW